MSKNFSNGCGESLREIARFADNALRKYDAFIAIGSSGFYLGAMIRLARPDAPLYFAPLSGTFHEPESLTHENGKSTIHFRPKKTFSDTDFEASVEAYRSYLASDPRAFDFAIWNDRVVLTPKEGWLDFQALQDILASGGRVALIDVSETAKGLMSATPIFQALFPKYGHNISPYILTADGFPHYYEDVTGQGAFSRPLTNPGFARVQREYDLFSVAGNDITLQSGATSYPCHVETTSNERLLQDLVGGCENGLRTMPRYVFGAGHDEESQQKITANRPKVLGALRTLHQAASRLHPPDCLVYAQHAALGERFLPPPLTPLFGS